MNLLILDDDKYVIEGIMNGVNWEALQFDNIYTALGTYQAKEILLKYEIDILLCDIEMPNEDGLSFVQWLRDMDIHILVIFFTSYANFQYAQKAITLNSFDYILKPVEYSKLTEIIQRALKTVEKENDIKKYQKMGEYWLKNSYERNESFWSKLLSRQTPYTKEELYRHAADRMLGYHSEDRFIIAVADYGSPKNSYEQDRLKLSSNQIKHQLEILFTDKCNKIDTIWSESVSQWYIIVNFTGCHLDKDRIREDGITFLQNNDRMIGKRGSLYLSKPLALEEAYGQMEQIKQMLFHNMSFRENVFFTDEFRINKALYQKPDMGCIMRLLNRGEKGKVIFYIDEYLDYHKGLYALTEDTLQCLQFDIMQLIFTMLHERQIEAHQLLVSTKTTELYEKSLDSIQNMKSYIHYLVETAMDYKEYIKEPDNVISKIEKYINDNMEKNITREDLARIVYLNPDYLARLFKNEKGISLLCYMTKQRMERAKELILTTREPICVVATKTGYPSCSYFSKKFREYYGTLPAEFKKSLKHD